MSPPKPNTKNTGPSTEARKPEHRIAAVISGAAKV
ncbi:hypothetical protein H4696_003071 [Amycolatopsis lexingtonensis]|uniref:Uncharacterized protein n=1 Tax=Amycolatopsis lexingtonensis TaxID=218822 RepID=A0ABR9HYH7_9PSEU|nr:hypothetical protein [Amycolatopsis lexingtonensis]